MYSVCEKLLVEHHEGRRCRNFAKWEFWKIEYVIFSKTQFDFWSRILQQKNNIFTFKDLLSLISFLEKSWGKKLGKIAKFL